MNLLKETRWWILAALVLVAALAVPAYTLIRAQSERRLLKEATENLEAGNIEVAIKTAHRAYQRNPGSHQAARLMALMLEPIQPEVALPWWKRALELKPDDFEAYTRILTLSMNSARPDEILRHIDMAHPDFQENPSFYKLAAVTCLKIGNYERALQAFAEATALDPGDHEARLGTWLIESQSSHAVQAEQAFRNILLAAEPGQPAETQALYNLITSNLNTRLEPAQIASFTDRYLKLQTTDFPRRLQAVLAAARLTRSHQEHWLQLMEEEVIKNPLHLAAYSQALNQQGDCQRVLSLRSHLEDFRSQLPGLHDILLDALIVEQHWTEAAAWVESIPEASRTPWQGIALQVAGVQGNWRQLDSQLLRLRLKQKVSPGQLDWISQKAEFHHWDSIREAALWARADLRGQEVAALRELIAFYQSRADGLGTLLASEKMLQADPDSLPAKATIAHLTLCRGERMDRAHRLAEECHRLRPDTPQVRMVYLLSLHLQGKDQEAYTILDQFSPEDRQLKGMGYYFNTFDWLAGTRPDPPALDAIPEGYLDLEIKLLTRLIERNTQTRPGQGLRTLSTQPSKTTNGHE